ncbi:MAG: hypothetical protein FD130_2134 [Halothiobacillaceae bacterium]|nr:MAG: hypothetical protein FD130_2134 [Halothiobacillaceae bacterium]
MLKSPAEIKKILIVRLSALGDVTLLVPVIRTLQQALPHAQITWLTSRGAYALLEGLDGVEFIVIDKPNSLSAYYQIKKQFGSPHFDLLFAMQASLRANLIYPLIRADLKIGFDRERARDGQWLFTDQRIEHAQQHLLDSFFAFLTPLGITQHELTWNIPIPPEAVAWAQRELPTQRPLLAINPGASKEERNWHSQGYATVIETAAQRWGTTAVLTGGPSERELKLGAEIEASISPLPWAHRWWACMPSRQQNSPAPIFIPSSSSINLTRRYAPFFTKIPPHSPGEHGCMILERCS